MKRFKYIKFVFLTVANDDHCFQSPALELMPMDMTGSESKQKEADGRKSTERNKISQNLPQGSLTQLTYQMTYPPSLETYDFEFTNFTLSCSVFLNKNTKLRKKCIIHVCLCEKRPGSTDLPTEKVEMLQ